MGHPIEKGSRTKSKWLVENSVDVVQGSVYMKKFPI